MVHPAFSQSHYTPQVMPVAPLNPHFTLENPEFVAALAVHAIGITEFADKLKEVAPLVGNLNADLLRNPVQFPGLPYPVTIQLGFQVVVLSYPSYLPNSQPALFNIPQNTPIPQPNSYPCPGTHGIDTRALDADEIAMSTFRQMFDRAKEVADIVNATLSNCPWRFLNKPYAEIAQYAPQLLVLPNSFYALPPQSGPLLPTPAQGSQSPSTNNPSPAADLVHPQEQQCDKTTHPHSKSKVNPIFLGDDLKLLANQYGYWLREEFPDESSKPPYILKLFITAFADKCATYLKQAGASEARLKHALSCLIYRNRKTETVVPDDLKTKFAAFTKTPLTDLQREEKELMTLALQYISWLDQKHKEVLLIKTTIWSVFTEVYRDKCDLFCSNSGLSKTELKRKFAHAKRAVKLSNMKHLPEVSEDLKNEFEEKIWTPYAKVLSNKDCLHK